MFFGNETLPGLFGVLCEVLVIAVRFADRSGLGPEEIDAVEVSATAKLDL